MRFVSKFYALSALAVCSILYLVKSLWTSDDYLPISGLQHPLFQSAETLQKRLVVFGDSWSDSDSREAEQGPAWTEWLCRMLSCHLENLAQSATPTHGFYVGAVVDNAELQDFQSALTWLREPLPDLGSQINQWLTVEEETLQNGLSDEAIQQRWDNTIFTVSFVLWDLWKFVGSDYDQAKDSISQSISTLFDQLNDLAERWRSDDLKIILLMSIDTTFLPAFTPELNKQKLMVKLVSAWNNELRNKAKEWDRGSIYLFDTNDFMLDQVREWQFFAAGIVNDAHNLSKNDDPGWEDVEHPCIQSRSKWILWNEKPCENPEKRLFWDDMHLGPSAHRILGTEIFHGIEDLWLNHTVSKPRSEQSVPETDRDRDSAATRW